MIGRSRYWRQDIAWFGPDAEVDLSHESRCLAWRLRGERFDEGDLYVMINTQHEPRTFRVQEGEVTDWYRIVDTNQPSPSDLAAPGEEEPLSSLQIDVAARSVVVLSRSIGECDL